MTQKHLNIQDYQSYEKSPVIYLVQVIKKAKKTEKFIGSLFSTSIICLSTLPIAHLLIDFFYNDNSLSLFQIVGSILALVLIQFIEIFKEPVVKAILYNPKYMQKMKEVFHYSFNAKNNYLKIFFSKFSEDYSSSSLPFGKSKLYDFFDRIDSMSISTEDIEDFNYIHERILRIAKHNIQSDMEYQKISNISQMAKKEFLTDFKESIQLEKEFNFTSH